MPRPAGAGSSLPVRAARDRRVRPTPRARLSARASAKARARRSGDAGRGAGAAVQRRRAIRAAAAMARRLTVHSAARQGNCMQPARGYGVVLMWRDGPNPQRSEKQWEVALKGSIKTGTKVSRDVASVLQAASATRFIGLDASVPHVSKVEY